MNQVLETILGLLSELHEDIDFKTEEGLADRKILDSFDLVTLVSELSEEFQIDISAENFIPENFNSAKALAAMVTRLMEE